MQELFVLNLSKSYCRHIFRNIVLSIAVYIHSAISLIVLSILQYIHIQEIADSIKCIVIYIQEYS